MNKRVIFCSILLTIGLLFTMPGASLKSSALSSASQPASQIREIKFVLQATDQPPVPIPTIVIPTIVINPTPGSTAGGFGQFGLLSLLVFVLVGAVVLIALVAILRRS